MIGLATAHKIRLARVLYRGVSIARAFGGRRSDIVVARRGGLRWRLDLSEGIDLSIYLFGRFERPVGRAIERHVRSGMVALDIGANVGAHALPMAVRVAPAGRVYAVEPTAWAYDRLMENRRLNPRLESALTPICAAIRGGDASSEPAEYYASWNLKPQSSVHEVHRGALRSARDARRLTVDALVAELNLSRLDFVKIDVDGSECDVIAGAADTLARLRPVILFEFSPHALEEHGCSGPRLLALLQERGYTFHDEGGRPRSPDDLLRIVSRFGSINVVAMP